MNCDINLPEQYIDSEPVKIDAKQQYKFFSEIVHESKNALTACEGFIQFMLIKKVFNTEYLEIVLSELRRTAAILNSYKQIASPGQNTEYCSLNSCINEVCTLLSAKFSLRHISIELCLSDIPDIHADADKIKQVLLNLLENAVDAICKNGSIKISTSYHDDKITLYIKDTGGGIDITIQDKLFTPFFTTKPNGTGLGLHICKSIIESYNGNISIGSSDKTGTEFIIELPVQDAVKSA